MITDCRGHGTLARVSRCHKLPQAFFDIILTTLQHWGDPNLNLNGCRWEKDKPAWRGGGRAGVDSGEHFAYVADGAGGFSPQRGDAQGPFKYISRKQPSRKAERQGAQGLDDHVERNHSLFGPHDREVRIES